MKLIRIILLLSVFLAIIIAPNTVCFAQEMNRADFQVGNIGLGVPFDSIKGSLGIPDSTRIYERWDYATSYFYSSLVIWVEKLSHQILAFDIYDAKYPTIRGLKIGDSLDVLKKYYPQDVIVENRIFDREGPFDISSKDYSEYRLYDYIFGEEDGWVLILFTKNNRLVKMLFYIGEPE